MREPRRITHIEVSEGNKKMRLVLIVAFLLIGAVAFTTGIMSLLNKDSGWQKVEISTAETSCSPNFVLQYNFSGIGTEATAQHKQISALYAEAAVKAYQVFQPEELYSGNLATVNAHPNEEVAVDPLLYSVLQKMQGTRYLYLGPVYAHYDNVIFSTAEEYLEEVDPAINADAKTYVAQLAAFAADETAVDLELLGDGKVKLRIGEEYLAFAKENEITRFLDLHYMTNAFIIDYLADTLRTGGFTNGFLASVDGYTRNLSDGEIFNYNLFDRKENTIYPAAVMQYRGPISMVFLKDFQTGSHDVNYRQSGDHVVHPFADLTDGMYRTSVSNLVGYSYEAGCADVLLKMLPGFLGDTFQLPQGIYSIWCEGSNIYYNDENIAIVNLLQAEQIAYSAHLKQ